MKRHLLLLEAMLGGGQDKEERLSEVLLSADAGLEKLKFIS